MRIYLASSWSNLYLNDIVSIPVAWRIHRATQRGSWMDPMVELLRELAPAVPKEMTVIVLCDRGIASPKLWRQIRAQGWHPYMRYRKNVTFCAPAAGCPHSIVSRPDTLDWPRHRLQHPQRKTPLHPVGGLVRRAGRTLDHPHRPATGGRRTQLVRPAPNWAAVKSLGQDQKDRSGADLPPLAGVVGGDAAGPPMAPGWKTLIRIAPGNLPRRPRRRIPRRDPWGRPVRTVSVIRHGIDWLRRLLLRGRLGRVCCCPNLGRTQTKSGDYSPCPCLKTPYIPLSCQGGSPAAEISGTTPKLDSNAPRFLGHLLISEPSV